MTYYIVLMHPGRQQHEIFGALDQPPIHYFYYSIKYRYLFQSRQNSKNPGGDPLFSLDMNTTDADEMEAEAKEIKLEFDESPDITFG